MNLDFLKNVGINTEELDKSTKRSGGGHRKEWNPTHPNTIRIWKDGSVFPSESLKDRFDLEYADRPTHLPEDSDKKGQWQQPGNALDIIDSNDFPVFKTGQRIILVNVVAKAAGKADLFAQVTWAEDGKPASSVMEQGSNTFGKATLLSMLQEVYGITLDDNTPYVDLVFVGKHGEDISKPDSYYGLPEGKRVAFVPKTVSRGGKKGEGTVTRREDPWLYILLPLLVLHPELAAKGKEPDSSLKQTTVAGAEPAVQN